MVKYRRLSIDELEELEKEFIQFLAVNGIDATKWQELKASKTNEADNIIDSFSDVVVEKSLQNIKYIEHRTSSDYKIFFYDEKEAHMIGVKSNSIDLLKSDWHKKAPEYFSKNQISLIKGTKKFSKSRTEELFEMLQKGCSPSEQKWFSVLGKLAE